jgi:hypothetical protein
MPVDKWLPDDEIAVDIDRFIYYALRVYDVQHPPDSENGRKRKTEPRAPPSRSFYNPCPFFVFFSFEKC